MAPVQAPHLGPRTCSARIGDTHCASINKSNAAGEPERAAPCAAKPSAASRKPSRKKLLRLPSRFAAAAAADKVRHKEEFEAAHAEMTSEAYELTRDRNIDFRHCIRVTERGD